MNRDVIRQIAVIASLGMTVTVNALANILPINGRTTGAVSDSFANFFVPAGYVFSIWGLIYLGLLGFVIYQALPSQKANTRQRAIGWWFVASNVANTAWIFCWHYGLFPLSLVAMLALLACLVMIYTRLDPQREAVRGAQRWLVDAPFSLYLGWITVAVIPNTSVVLIDQGWGGLGISGEVWAVALLAIATAIGALVALPRRDWVYSLVLVWAFAGIGVKFATLPLLSGAAFVAAAAMAIVALLGLARRWNVLAFNRSNIEALKR